MPEKKRKFEVDAHLVQNLTLHPRPKKTGEDSRQESRNSENSPLPALPPTQDVVLRLINTLKKI